MGKKKVNGFSLFVSEFNRKKGGDPALKWSAANEAKTVWEGFTEEEKQVYKDRATDINNRENDNYVPIKRRVIDIEMPINRIPGLPKPKLLRELTKPDIRTYIEKCFVEYRQICHSAFSEDPKSIPYTDFIFLSFGALTNIPYHDPQYGEFVFDSNTVSHDVDYTLLYRVDVIPVEVTIMQYSLSKGVVYSFHSMIKPGPIPMGYKFAAYKSSDETHQVPIEGTPESLTLIQLADVLEKIGNHVASNKLCCYVLSSDFDVVSQSLSYISYMTDYKNKIFPILPFEMLAVDLINNCGIPDMVNSLSLNDVRNILDQVSITYNDKLRCAFHYNIGNRFCSMVKVLGFSEFLHSHVTSMYQIQNTDKHKPISTTLNDLKFSILS